MALVARLPLRVVAQQQPTPQRSGEAAPRAAVSRRALGLSGVALLLLGRPGAADASFRESANEKALAKAALLESVKAKAEGRAPRVVAPVAKAEAAAPAAKPREAPLKAKAVEEPSFNKAEQTASRAAKKAEALAKVKAQAAAAASSSGKKR